MQLKTWRQRKVFSQVSNSRRGICHDSYEPCKTWKSLISLYNLGSRPQKSPKIPKKKIALIRDLLKKMLRARVRSILMPPTSHIASLNRHTPKFSGVGLKLAWIQPFGVQGLPKSGKPDLCPPKMAILRWFFFAQNQFSRPNSKFLPIACHTCFESFWPAG